jgi:hypothetical protein
MYAEHYHDIRIFPAEGISGSQDFEIERDRVLAVLKFCAALQWLHFPWPFSMGKSFQRSRNASMTRVYFSALQLQIGRAENALRVILC